MMKDLTKIEEILLIAIWRLNDKAYGVKIRKHVSEVAGRDLTYGHLYSALNQLVLKKFVIKTEGDPVPGRSGRPRIYYSISPQGVKALKSALELHEKLWQGISRYALEKKE